VDAKAQLRRYLEQRRDAGDQELVLDTMSVDEVMRLLGAMNNRQLETEVPIPAVPVPPALLGRPHAALSTLEDVAAAATVCTRCSLHKTATHCVPGEGSSQAKLVCVGEAPGETEDQTGRPFVGRAGQLLTKILAAIDVKREDAFIVNVLKHRPPGNRNPLPDEVAACSPFLVRQIELLQPKVILALGTFAAQTLLDTKLSIGKLRGTMHQYYGVPLIVTYHPAALLRNPHWKRPAWEDVQQARRLLDANPAADGA
jgi:uracil-DNA glycosylase